MMMNLERSEKLCWRALEFGTRMNLSLRISHLWPDCAKRGLWMWLRGAQVVGVYLFL